MSSACTWWESADCGGHLEWIVPIPESGNRIPETSAIGIFRVFTQPVGPRDPETGQPWKPWEWQCTVIVEGGKLRICGAALAPSLAMVRLARMAARDIGATVLAWERWSCGRKRVVEVSL